jgi:CubicO group peptidase (beta-lactamase class C family)
MIRGLSMNTPPSSLPRTLAVIDEGLAAGLHIGAQLYISHHGQVLADLAVGQAGNGAAMTPDTLMLWLSAGKPLAAIALAQLWEQKKLDLDDPVIRFIPEFAPHGKEHITLRHLLTHTAGIRWVDTGWPDASWDQILARIAAMRPEPRWIPGQTAGYHVLTSWFVLGEIIHRLTGTPYADYIRAHIFLPAGMTDAYIALTADQYAAYGDRMGIMHKTQSAPPRPVSFDTPRHAAAASPGATARGPIRQLARLYEILLNRGRLSSVPTEHRAPSAEHLLSPPTIEALTARHRTGLYDKTFKTMVDWGLGFILNSSFYNDPLLPYNYGPHASHRTFGHSGSQSSTAFADPEHALVVAVVFNGMPGDAPHNQRQRALCTAIYEDLGLIRDE